MIKSRVPRYHQIAQSLRERMADGRLQPGARMDNQRRLAQEFGVTLAGFVRDQSFNIYAGRDRIVET